MKNEINRVAIAWYRADQWEQLLEISEDSAKLEKTFDEWLRNAKRLITEIVIAGSAPVKIDVETEALLKWCNSEGRTVDASSRTDYALSLARKGENIIG